jgi:PAS domain S-box-containing protein
MFDINKIIKYSKNLTLLYVEDNKATRDSTLMIFENLFDNIIVGVDGKDGLEKFKNNNIDLVIADLNMPKLCGTEMIREIRKIQNLIPVIVLSAHDEDEYIIGSIRRGVSTYLSKPLDIGKLFQAIYESIHQENRDIRVVYDNDIVFEKYKNHINPSSIVTIFDTNGIVLYVNDSFAHIFGYPKKEIVGRPYYTLSKEKHDDELIQEIWETIKVKKEIWSGTMRYVNNFDEVYFLRGTVNPILDKNQNIIEYVSIREDIPNMVEDKFKIYESK